MEAAAGRAEESGEKYQVEDTAERRLPPLRSYIIHTSRETYIKRAGTAVIIIAVPALFFGKGYKRTTMPNTSPMTKKFVLQPLGGEGGTRTLAPEIIRPNGLANRPLHQLGYFS